MTISSTTIRDEYNGNDSQTVFPYTFKIFDEDDVAVYEDGVLRTKTTHYTVSGVGEESGGNITFIDPPATGTKNVVLILDVDILQSIDYVEGDDFAPETHERGLDKLTQIALMLNEMIGRAVKLDIHSTYEDLSLPDPEAGKFLAWNDGLTALVNAVSAGGEVAITSFMETLLDDTTAELAKATLLISPGTIKMVELLINNGAGANTITILGTDRYNGDGFSQTPDISKGGTQNNISLSAGGNQLTLDVDALGVTAWEGVVNVVIALNKTQYDMEVRGYTAGDSLHLLFTAAPQNASGTGTKGGTDIDLTAAVDTGDGPIYVMLTYASSE